MINYLIHQSIGRKKREHNCTALTNCFVNFRHIFFHNKKNRAWHQFYGHAQNNEIFHGAGNGFHKTGNGYHGTGNGLRNFGGGFSAATCAAAAGILVLLLLTLLLLSTVNNFDVVEDSSGELFAVHIIV